MTTEMAWSQLPTDLGCITPPHMIANITEIKTRQVFLPHSAFPSMPASSKCSLSFILLHQNALPSPSRLASCTTEAISGGTAVQVMVPTAPSAPCCPTTSASVLRLVRATTFHTHVKQWATVRLVRYLQSATKVCRLCASLIEHCELCGSYGCDITWRRVVS